MATSTDARFHGIPPLIYGTAFKFDRSASLTTAAFHAGFRALDTAGSASAYREAAVGEGLAAFLRDRGGEVQRRDVFTKFSPFKAGKDPKLYPYDTQQPIEAQVQQSIESSCRNLQTDYIDCLVLHSVYPDVKDTLRAWKAMESLVPARVSRLGVSNTDLATLRTLHAAATVKPATVQNRFTGDTVSRPNASMPADLPYPVLPYDSDVRAFCAAHDIAYSPWGVLWGNPGLMENLLQQRETRALLDDVGITVEVACLACVQAAAGCKANILCGTKKVEHMDDVLQGTQQRIPAFCAGSQESGARWRALVDAVRRLIDSEAEGVESVLVQTHTHKQ